MLRLTVTVYQVMSDAHVVATVHQESDYEAPACLGEARTVFDMSSRLDDWDELTSLIHVVKTWSGAVLER